MDKSEPYEGKSLEDCRNKFDNTDLFKNMPSIRGFPKMPAAGTRPEEFEGHPLECATHPGRISFGCPECYESNGVTKRIGAVEAWRLAIINEARAVAALRVPFKHRGRAATGMDCSGLFVYSATAVGVPFIAYRDAYPKGFHGDDFVREFSRRMDEVDIKDAEPSDALLVEVRGAVCHAMMLTERGTLIHAHALWRRVTEHQFTFEWAEKVRHVFRYRGG